MDWSKLDNSPSALSHFLKYQGLAPKKRWGQNFMVAPWARHAFMAALGVRSDDVVWEIGPGFGAITTLLVEGARTVVVFEIDHGIMRILRERFGSAITIVAGDAVKRLDVKWLDPKRLDDNQITPKSRGGTEPAERILDPAPPEPHLVAGSLPYRSAAAIIAVLLEMCGIWSDCRRMVFTVQREIGRRMIASPGGKEYSPFSVLCALSASVTYESEIAAGSFYPVPKVVSSLISIEPKQIDHELLQVASICARSLFSSRRKTIRNNLSTLASAAGKSVATIQQALDCSGIDSSLRAETVDPESYLLLAECLHSRQ